MKLTLALFLLLLATPVAAKCVCLKCLNPRIDSWTLPSGSMEPTLPVGSCITTLRPDDPSTVPVGAIVVFEHPVTGATFIKRLIATGGQTVQMIDGQVWVNGVVIPQTPLSPYIRIMQMTGQTMPRCGNGAVGLGADCITDRFRETLAGTSYDVLNIATQPGDNTGIYTVPEGYIFVLGDNRDNSTDSRIAQAARGIGFVPLGNIIGVYTQK